MARVHGCDSGLEELTASINVGYEGMRTSVAVIFGAFHTGLNDVKGSDVVRRLHHDYS